MADEYSFDVVSKVDPQAVEDAVNTAMKEIGNRYDFKGSISKIEYDKKESKFTLHSDDDMRLKALTDVLNTRLAKRSVPLRNLKPEAVEKAGGDTLRQVIKIQQGIPTDKAKEMAAELKKSGLKVQASIQSEQLRVSSKVKDNLQAAIAFLRGKDFGLDLQFTNYR